MGGAEAGIRSMWGPLHDEWLRYMYSPPMPRAISFFAVKAIGAIGALLNIVREPRTFAASGGLRRRDGHCCGTAGGQLWSTLSGGQHWGPCCAAQAGREHGALRAEAQIS